MAVRAKKPAETQGQLTAVEFDSKTFFLVEIKAHQLRMFGQEPSLRLSVDPAGLVKKASEVLDSDVEIIFASATEQESVDRGRKPKTSKHRKDSSTSSSSSDMEEDDPFGVLRKSWLGEDIGGGEQKRHSSAAASGKSRFPLLDRREKEITKNSDDLDLGKVLSHLKGGKDPVQSLLALHLVESLKGKLKKGRSSHSRDKSISASSSSSGDQDSSGSEHHRRRGHARAVETYQNSKRRMFRKPLKYTRKYVKEVERDLGAENRPYHLSEIGKKIAWGKQKSLQRCHYMLSDILTKLLKGQTEKATLQTVLCLRSVHQAALDGDWNIAWLLTHLPDPWTRKQWGGDPEDLGNVTAYLKSMADLNKSADKIRQSSGAQGSETAESLPGGKARDKKGKGKGKDKKEEDRAES